VRLRCDPPASAVTCEADAEQLHQLLVNLLLNALDVVPRGGSVEVRLGREAGGDGVVGVDTGPGVPQAQLPPPSTPFASRQGSGAGGGAWWRRGRAGGRTGPPPAPPRGQGGGPASPCGGRGGRRRLRLSSRSCQAASGGLPPHQERKPCPDCWSSTTSPESCT